MLEAVIFDMDGVLLDSEPLHMEADRAIFKKLGFLVTPKEQELFLGMGAEGTYSWLKERFGLNEPLEELLMTDTELRMQFFVEGPRLVPLPGVIALLEDLRKHDIPMALGSSTVAPIVYRVLNKLNVQHFFKHIVTGDLVAKTKPDPSIFLLCAERLGALPAHCAVIEDSDNGITAAKTAGMKVVCYGPNGTPGSANLTVKSFSELNTQVLEALMR